VRREEESHLILYNIDTEERTPNFEGICLPKSDDALNTPKYKVFSNVSQTVGYFSYSLSPTDYNARYIVMENNTEFTLTTKKRIIDSSTYTNQTNVHVYIPNSYNATGVNGENSCTKRSSSSISYEDEDEKTFVLKKDLNSNYFYVDSNTKNEKYKYYNGKYEFTSKVTIKGCYSQSYNYILPEKTYKMESGRIYFAETPSDSITDLSDVSYPFTSGELSGIVLAGFAFVIIVIIIVYCVAFTTVFSIFAFLSDKKNLLTVITAILAIINVAGSITISAMMRKYFEPVWKVYQSDGLPRVFIYTERANIAVPVVFIVVGCVSWFLASRMPGFLRTIFALLIVAVAIMEAVTNSVFNSINTRYYGLAYNVRYQGILQANADQISLAQAEELLSAKENITNINQFESGDYWRTIHDKSATFMVMAYVVLTLSIVYWFFLTDSQPSEKNENTAKEEKAEV